MFFEGVKVATSRFSRFPPRHLEATGIWAKVFELSGIRTLKIESRVCDLPPGGSEKKELSMFDAWSVSDFRCSMLDAVALHFRCIIIGWMVDRLTVDMPRNLEASKCRRTITVPLWAIRRGEVGIIYE